VTSVGLPSQGVSLPRRVHKPHVVVQKVVSRDPDHLTIEARKEQRKGRLLIDVMRNAYAQIAMAAYAVRAKPGAPISTPVTWQEVGSSRLTSQRYTLRNLSRLLEQRPDPWASMFRQAPHRAFQATPAVINSKR
jgi:bifunctional non-homologous end joining protein LigD